MYTGKRYDRSGFYNGYDYLFINFEFVYLNMIDRISKTIIAIIVCWLMLPIILVLVAVVCALIPFVAFVRPDVVKIGGK